MLLPLSCGTPTPDDPADGNTDGNDPANVDGGQTDVDLADDGHPVGWSKQTHSNDVDADYSQVFPDAQVNRLDITISAADWQTMQDNMIELYGQPGAGTGDGGGQIPDGDLPGPAAPGAAGDWNTNGAPPGGTGAAAEAMFEACIGMEEGDACTASVAEVVISGTCEPSQTGELVCNPRLGPGNLPDGTLPGDNQPPNGTPPNDATTGGGAIPDDAQPAGGVGMGSKDNPVYVPCTVEFDGLTWWYVGIRYKGQSSLSSTWSSGIAKLPLRLDFDQFEDDYPEIDNQRFYGFKELSLASNWSDSSYLREKVAHDIFREAGVPAPRTAFYRVYVDFGEGSTYFGLYTMTEIPDDPMLLTQFGNDDGNLYKPTSNWVSFNEDDFDKETNKDEGDWSDVQAAIAALNADRSDVEAWRTALEATLDVDGFLRWLAVNTVIQNWDTYGNMAQNYYLYGDPDDDGRLNWIPWDNNMALSASGGMGGGAAAARPEEVADVAALADQLDRAGGMSGGALSLSLDEVSDNWPLIRYLADDPVYWEIYVTYVSETIEDAFAVQPTQARYQAAHDLIAPYVVGTEGEQTGYTFLSDPQEFQDGLDELMNHVEQRREAVLEFLADTP